MELPHFRFAQPEQCLTMPCDPLCHWVTVACFPARPREKGSYSLASAAADALAAWSLTLDPALPHRPPELCWPRPPLAAQPLPLAHPGMLARSPLSRPIQCATLAISPDDLHGPGILSSRLTDSEPSLQSYRAALLGLSLCPLRTGAEQS